MRWHEIASQILLILSIFNFVLAAPVAVREINEVRINAVDAAKVRMAVSEKRMNPGEDPEDRWSTNERYLAEESEKPWDAISLGSAESGSYTTSESDTESDTATSKSEKPWDAISLGSTESDTESDTTTSSSGKPSVTGNPGSGGNPSPSHSVSTNDPPQSPQPAPDLPPPSSPQPAPYNSPPSSPPPDNSHPPPPNSGPSTGPHQLTDDHSPPSTEPQHPWAAEYENFFSKLMKGRFKRSISGYGPGNVVQRELQGTVGPIADIDKLFNGPAASASGGVIGRGAGTHSHKFQVHLQN